MTRTYLAELTKLARLKVVVVTTVASLVFAVGGSAVVLAAAEPAAERRGSRGPVPTLEALATAGGGSQVFRVAAAFAGTFLFVVFVGVVAVEFSRGTIRTMLIREPRRRRVLSGKVAALLSVAAVTLAVTQAATWVAARLQAPSAGIDASGWTSWAGVGAAFADFGAILLWVTAYAVLGTALAVLLRSVPLALAVGIAWAGPVEHLVQDAWAPASRLFPGLLLEAFVAGGTSEVSASRAVATVAAYVVVAAVVATTVFARRDVTA